LDRRNFIKLAAGASVLPNALSPLDAPRGFEENEAPPNFPTRVISRQPPLRWEDAMISGNGSTGIMVMGRPLDDCVIVNHEKLWTVGNDYLPKTPSLREAWDAAKAIARTGRYLDADRFIGEEARKSFRRMYGEKAVGSRPGYDRTHPGFHLNVAMESDGAPLEFRRETNLETGEISVFWTDNRGDWVRRIFVSRTHDVIVLELAAPAGSVVNAKLRLVEALGKLAGDIGSIRIEHGEGEMYFHAAYGRTMGKAKAEGYHALARVIVSGGRTRAVENERLEIVGAKNALVLVRLEYLDEAAAADRASLRLALSRLPADYGELLEPHAAAHGEMFRRVTLDLGGHPEKVTSSETLLAQAARGESLPEFFELMHAAGRYALICGGTGELAPSLMGIWGNEWNPPWDGRYTFDANLNLAVSAASQGNLPEVIATFTSFLERYVDQWRENAKTLYGCRGVVTDLCQGWRHAAVLMATYPWTGGAGWLARYLYDHYLFTQDRAFLASHVVPLLKDVADFYEDFLPKYPEKNGRFVFYPSISPENEPVMIPADQTTNVVPNATGEIAICREALTTLIAACRELGTDADAIPRWESLLAKLPDYVINRDGALAEWAYPGLGDNYNHRHSSHLYGIYPSLEISPERTPKLFEAARVAMEKRLEAGLGGDSAHGLMHVSFVAARLKNAGLMRRMLTDFSKMPFVNTSFITCHNPGPRIYNLDTTFCMPAVLMEMLVYSEPGLLELLPALPQDQFGRGTLRGVLARGGVTVEELHWNKTLGSIYATLRSGRAQSLALRLGVDYRTVDAEDPADRSLVAKAARGRWRIDLPARRSVRLICRR
jgi:hypothetical protein